MRSTSAPPVARSPFDVIDATSGQRPAKRALSSPEVTTDARAPDATPTLELRLGAVEMRQASLSAFRQDVTRDLHATEKKLTYLNERDEDTRKQLADLRSQLAAFGIELHQGLPQLTAQVQANAQELVGMQEASRNFVRDGRALQADLERLKADLTMLHAQAQFAAAATAPLLPPQRAQAPPPPPGSTAPEGGPPQPPLGTAPGGTAAASVPMGGTPQP